MTYYYKEHLTGANVTILTDHKCRVDSRGLNTNRKGV